MTIIPGNSSCGFLFSAPNEGAVARFQDNFSEIANSFSMHYAIEKQDKPLKTLILVSKASHCLNDLLYRWRTRSLNIDIVGVIGNHDTNQSLAEDRSIPFTFVDSSDKQASEETIRTLAQETGAELIVLARYMQVMSEAFCRDFEGKVINIHHSFLPGFKGARPYRQAYEQGVKIIGATAHFATADLDEGPIIEQGIMRVDHTFNPQKMQTVGRDTEARVLARAIELYSERRIFLNDGRTVILKPNSPCAFPGSFLL